MTQVEQKLSGNIAIITAAWISHIEKRYATKGSPFITSVGPHSVVSWEDQATIGFTDSNEMLIVGGQGGETIPERLQNYFVSIERNS